LGQIKKQSIQSTLYIYIGVLIGFISTGILMPRFLTESENGVLKLLVSYSLLFAQLSTLGLPISTVKFLPYFRNGSKKNFGYFMFLFIIGIIGFLIFLSVFFVFEDSIYQHESSKSPLFAQYLYLIIPLTFFFTYFNLLDGYARSLVYSTIGAFLKELLQRVFILISLGLFIFGIFDFHGFISSYIVSLSLPTIILFIYISLKGEVGWKIHWSKFDKKILKQIFVMAAFGLFLGLSQLAISQIDSIMINYFHNDAKTGIYAITFYYGTLVIIPSRALFRITPTFIAEAFKSSDLNTIKDIQYKSCLNQYIIGLGIFLLLWLNIDNVYKILPLEYIEGKFVIFYIGLANLFNMTGGVSSQIITNSPHYRYNGLFVIIYLILIVLTNYIMIPLYGIVGAAVASTFSVLIFVLIKYFFLLKKYRIQPYNLKYLTTLLFAGVLYAAIYYLPMPEAFIPNLLIKSFLFGGLYIFFIYKTGYSQDITELIESYKKKWFR
jgi:O-antigen/teichoic acid export membrane protein